MGTYSRLLDDVRQVQAEESAELGTYDKLLNSVNSAQDEELAQQGPALQFKPGQSQKSQQLAELENAVKSLNNLFKGFKPF